MILAVGSYVDFIMYRQSHMEYFFNHKRLLNSVKCFSLSVEIITFFLHYTNVMYGIDFYMFNYLWLLNTNSIYSVCDAFKMLNLVASIFGEISVSKFMRYWSVIFFPCSVFVWLWYLNSISLIECVWKYFLLYDFLDEF